MAGLEPVVGCAERQLGHAAGCRVDERALDGLRGVRERVIERRIAECSGRREPRFGQVHQRILQRPAAG